MSIKATLGLGFALSLCLGHGLHAQTPLSAIDWLNQIPPADTLSVLSEDPVAGEIESSEITVMPLDAARLDGLGVLSSAQTGLPRTLWGTSSAQDIAALLLDQPAEALPAVQDMLMTLLLAELDPPENRERDGILLSARIDQLLRMGALDQAAALLDQVSHKNAPMLERMINVGLLIGQEERACAALRAAPGIPPEPAVQVFCLARGGDWNAAQLTLDTAGALGTISAPNAALLQWFLNPEQDDTAVPPPRPDPLTPLAFRVLEAIGEPLPTSALALAYAQSDLRALNGWKAQIEAAERLARARAIPAELLFSIYAEGRPAASGGVWERVRAVQALDAALRARDATAVAATLASASHQMQQAGLDVALAEFAAPLLADLPLPGQVGALAYRLLLLAPDPETAAHARTATGGFANEQFVSGLAMGDVSGTPASSALEQAIALAFGDTTPPPALAQYVDSGRLGEAILRAAKLISAGIESDPGDVATALQLFRSVGLERVARATALQLVLMSRPAA